MSFELINGMCDPAAGFPARLARWLHPRAELIDALVALRHKGHAPDAVAALLALPDVERLRAEWEDWLTGVDDADRAASLILNKVPADVLTDAIYALWGTPVQEGHRSGCRRRYFFRRHLVVIKRQSPRALQTGKGYRPRCARS